MSPHIRSFASFSVFFLSTALAFWPVALLVVSLLTILPAMLYWDSDILLNLEMLIAGVHLPEKDWMLIFMVPSFILGLPLILSHYGGELMDSQVEIYHRLTEYATTPYGLLGWALTITLLGFLFYWALWCVRHVLTLSDTSATNYLALLTMMLGGAVLCI